MLVPGKNDSEIQISRSSRMIENSVLFNNKLEPLKWIHLLLGLRSYRMKGSYLKKGAWWASLYLAFLTILAIVCISHSIVELFIRLQGVSLNKIGLTIINISSLLHMITNWMLNINSNKVIKILDKFNYVEKTFPSKNAYLYNSNVLNTSIHSFEIFLMAIQIVINYDAKTQPNVAQFFYTFFNISMDFSVYQLCNIMNMISSYGNVVNTYLLNFYNLPHSGLENKNVIIYVLKKYILRFASFNHANNMRETFTETQDIYTFMKVNEKLLDIVQITNNKFNIIVSISNVLLCSSLQPYKHYSVLSVFFFRFFLDRCLL